MRYVYSEPMIVGQAGAAVKLWCDDGTEIKYLENVFDSATEPYQTPPSENCTTKIHGGQGKFSPRR